MTETPFFFSNGEHRLFGVLHTPQESIGQGFVFCHAFAEEKLWAHRVFVNFARILAKSGYPVLRFDYMGHGDSSGKFEDSTVDTRLSDISCAIRTLQDSVEPLNDIYLLGLRFGATLAALAAEREKKVSGLILWEPVLLGTRHLKEMIRINLSTQTAVFKEIRFNSKALVQKLQEGETINLDGYEIRLPLYNQMATIDLTQFRNRPCGKVLAVQINKSEKLGIKRIEGLKKRYKNCAILEVAEQPFWKEIKKYYAVAPNLYEITLAWLREI